ncbi:MAG: hypothetical protein ACTHJW_23835 [Streptosporangiaceae bacterium]
MGRRTGVSRLPAPDLAHGGRLVALKWLLALGVSVLAVLTLSSFRASAATPTDCLARHHVCVGGDGRGLISKGQQAQLEKQIGDDAIYLVIGASGASGYNRTMDRIISGLSAHERFTVGFLDTRLRHLGAYNKGMLPPHAAADIASTVVDRHRADQNIFAALTDFVSEVQHEASSSSGGTAADAPSDAVRNVLIAFGAILVLVALGIFLIARPIRKRRNQQLREAKSAAQDDLIALSTALTDHRGDAAIQQNPEAADEQGSALTCYERGTTALDAAKRARDMGAVSRAIAEGQYHLSCADALAAGQPRPDRRPSCFFDPRHGMSVSDGYWTPADGRPGRAVPVCPTCAHKLDRGIEPEMRKVESDGAPVSYINAGFAPTYWGGFGFAPALFTGFLLGEVLTPHAGFADGYYSDGGDYGGDDYGGGDFGGGDFGGGDYGGGDFGGGDFGGGDFGGGDFG